MFEYANLKDSRWKLCVLGYNRDKITFPCRLDLIPTDIFKFYRDLTDEEYKTRCEKILKEDEECSEYIKKNTYCKNKFWDCSLHPRTVSKIEICMCSGCSSSYELEGKEYHKRNVKNSHCISCKCNECVCPARASLNKRIYI